MVLALRKLEWSKDTPRWVTTNTTSKKGAKGRLFVVVKFIGSNCLVYVRNGVRGEKLWTAHRIATKFGYL